MRIKFSAWFLWLAALILPGSLFAETSISGYQGSRWKDTPAQVKAALIGKEYKVEEDGKVISYKDALLDENVKIKFFFEQDSLTMVRVDLLLPTSNLAEFMRVYRKFMTHYTETYGQPAKVIKKGITDLDNDNLMLLATGGGYYLNIWEKADGWLEIRVDKGDYSPKLRLTYVQAAPVQKRPVARTTVAGAIAAPVPAAPAASAPTDSAMAGSASRGFKGLTFGIRPSLYWLPKVGGFKITKEDNSESIEIEGKTAIGLSPYLQMEIAPELAMEFALDGFWGSETRLLVGSASLIGRFDIWEDIKPYLKLGVYYGKFYWNKAGNFDGGLGFQFGGGIKKKLDEHWGIGLDITGRYLKNKYNAPSGWKAESDAIDLSGIAVSGEVFYKF